MPTPNFSLPLIDGASPISIVNDMNALATAADSAMGTLATHGDISAVKTIAQTATTQATAAQKTAEAANGAAEGASKSATDATALANSAISQAKNAQATATEALERAQAIEAHTYFTNMTEHPNNPWRGKSTIFGRQANDGSRIEVVGSANVRPIGGGQYCNKADVTAKIVTSPSGTQGIPLFTSTYTPISRVSVANCGLFFFTGSSSAAYNNDSVYTCTVWLDTDGVVYLTVMNYQQSDYVYGFLSTGPFPVK